jgi:ComF family protein
VNSAAVNVLNDFVSLFFPRFCAACHDSLVKGEELICTKCILEMPRSNFHVDIDNAFFRKFKGRIPVKYVMSFFKFTKGGSVQQVLHTLKYRNKPELGRLLGRIYGEELKSAGYANAFDIIIPIPLHSYKKQRRGYNQSEEFGKGLSEALNVPCSEQFLSRVTVTTTQTKKTRLKRWENVKEVFAVHHPEMVGGKNILLIDDVVTTGATLEAAGRLLVDAGCSQLSIGCIAATY